MKTLIISSSLSPNSRSYLLCRKAEELLSEKSVQIDFIDSREYVIRPHWSDDGKDDRKIISKKVMQADNIIFGMGVHTYSVSDNLKLILDNCMEHATGKFFAILCAGGGEYSYLSTMHLTQICMNEWRMIQLPRTVYASEKHFKEEHIISQQINERLRRFADEFHRIGSKLIS